MNDFPADIQNFASKFVELQKKRHQADYDPIHKFKRHDVLNEIYAAEVAIKQLQALGIRHQGQKGICCLDCNDNKINSPLPPPQ